jgi:hypothetical protein
MKMRGESEIRNPKTEGRNPRPAAQPIGGGAGEFSSAVLVSPPTVEPGAPFSLRTALVGLRTSDFGFRISFGVRISDFGF